MYFYFIWKHCHSKVVIFPMPHEKKKRKGKESCKNGQRLFIQDNYYISNTTFGGTYMLCKIKITF